MNKDDIRTRAREITDLEVGDVSDDVIDLYIKDGYERMIAIEGRWPFLEYSRSVQSVADDSDLMDMTDADGDDVFGEITSIIDSDSPWNRLKWTTHDQVEGTWVANGSGRPEFWSIWNNTVRLWPTPDSIYTYTVRGYRLPYDWTATTVDEVDADSRLHIALVYYVVSQLYQLQEDVELAAFYRRTFDEAVKLAHGAITGVPTHSPLILSGGFVRTVPRFPRYRTD